MSSSLESLPNEVLWLSWEYLPAIDLFRSFHNLNQRFNTILHSMHYRLDLLHLNKSEMNYFLGTILPHVERQRIESIFLDDIAERLFWIHSCQHLRSLTIRNLRPMSIEPVTRHILVELKMLNYLCLQSEFTLRDEDLNVLTSTIFSDRMPSLTYCHLAFENFEKIRFDHLSTNNRSLSLKSLVFDQWCRLRDFIRLLHFVPNIKRLTVRLFDSDSKGMLVPSLASIDDFTTLVPHLIYLRTKLSHISLTLASSTLFLRLPSTLRELSLSTWSIDYANGHAWENLLSRKFPSLKHFRLIISLDRIPENHSVATTEDLDGLVQSFNQSKYFLDHRWTVLLNVNDNGPLKFVLHTLPYPIENFQSTLLNIRRSTATPPMIKAAYRDVSRLTLSLQDDPCPISLQQNEHRRFPRLDQLTFLSNLTEDIPQFQSSEYLSYLRHMMDLSAIKKLIFSEEVHQYPIDFVRCLMEQLPQVISLTVANRLFVRLRSQTLCSLKSLTLIFTIYSPSSTATIRMHYLLQFHQKLTNDLILELVRRVPTDFPSLQTLSLVVRDLDVFDQQLPEWLRSNFSSSSTVKYDLNSIDGILLFHF